MTTLSLLFGLVLLLLGGDSVVKAASGLAQRLKLSPFATGMFLVAFATSIPELAVNTRAYFTGSQSLALGNAVGSNIVNFGLTLGVAALVAPLTIRWRGLAPLLLCLMAATIATIALGYDGALSRIEGIVFLVAFLAVLVFATLRSRSESEDVKRELTEYEATDAGLGRNALRLAIGAVALYYGAYYVVKHAPVLGQALGMTPLTTGLLIVAIGTALPEVVTAAIAARRGQGDIVAGHVIGSSLFNLLAIVGGMAALRDLPIPASFVRFELPAALAFSLLLYPMLRRDLHISRGEGAVLVLALIGWVAFEFVLMR
ncbi:MAG: sodium:calcium antiporter [Xanthomonadaceae bacterium]|nr:sodium:calcium antiporter [Xanthomonadaceae bacterium]